MNFSFDAILLIKSFLEADRKQFVERKNIKSCIASVVCGVPQASQLAAPLYLIFINDIFNLDLKGKIQLYADDIAITYSCDLITELHDHMQNDLNTLAKYFKINKLLLNEKKTKYIIFKQKDIGLQHFSLSYNNENKGPSLLSSLN